MGREPQTHQIHHFVCRKPLTCLGSCETMLPPKRRRCTVKLENLTIVFENCEEVVVPSSAIVYMHLGKVSENYYFDRGDSEGL